MSRGLGRQNDFWQMASGSQHPSRRASFEQAIPSRPVALIVPSGNDLELLCRSNSDSASELMSAWPVPPAQVSAGWTNTQSDSSASPSA